MPRRLALGHAVPTGDADLPIKFHGIDLPALPARCRQDIGGRLLRRPKRDYPAATVVGFCTAALNPAVTQDGFGSLRRRHFPPSTPVAAAAADDIRAGPLSHLCQFIRFPTFAG